MRCKACNAILTDAESVRKQPDGSFEDLCNQCLIVALEYDSNDEMVVPTPPISL